MGEVNRSSLCPCQVRKLQMYGTTLFHVHNSKIFPSGHFLVAASSSGIQFLHPITKEELHSPFFFSDLQRCSLALPLPPPPRSPSPSHLPPVSPPLPSPPLLFPFPSPHPSQLPLSPFQSPLLRWEYTPKTFCFWSTKSDYLDEEKQGRHIVKYSLSTKQGWEISTTLHSYYKILMQTEVTVSAMEGPAPAPTNRRGQIT